ncbi:hypothetical protein [Paenibacillus alginolyticus]|uniref:Uncharacterized protein n=1 Tax=Paenibacillus alginolyticus TaxID=59839 RepID=A0ABT4GJF2_9BACL|nr:MULTISPECIES: hypothetical protein [Paenibacillus]MCY9696332.1 hypothetical protein [Paenibacillus alginolyticus]MEC0142607.1 hypothetical protein [Paenibacillus alginolyticus]NRF91119.1 hypothetical protein [Paenibacillus frigoriresistens]
MSKDRHGGTKRHIRVDYVKEDMIKAFCFTAKASRVFRIDRIMAIQEVKRYA